MASWISSWLPALPSINISLPSSVQARFISFALKRSLGHLFKPGQLETHKIDSQVGSGYVQITDVELNEEVSLYAKVSLLSFTVI
jgi:autophagy-related protein 2